MNHAPEFHEDSNEEQTLKKILKLAKKKLKELPTEIPF